VHDIPGFDADEIRKVMRDNAWSLATPTPA